ncbi:MAG TPA: hypothetical protein VKF60_02455 [Myxococcota bacterium]|nr:hypothetical protein [Myxococcota bacterium]
MSRESAAIGMRVKTGRAIAVLVSGSRKRPRILERREVTLYDPAVPHSGQPYHVALELGEKRAAPLLARALEAVRVVGRREFRALTESLAGSGHALSGVGLVVGSLGDPAKLGNLHVRAHALEGQLYWQVLDAAARELGLDCAVVTEKEIYARASESLKLNPDALRSAVAELGYGVGRPWGADEKTAALAAWQALSH